MSGVPVSYSPSSLVFTAIENHRDNHYDPSRPKVTTRRRRAAASPARTSPGGRNETRRGDSKPRPDERVPADGSGGTADSVSQSLLFPIIFTVSSGHAVGVSTTDDHGAEARAVTVRTTLESAAAAGGIDPRPRGREGERRAGSRTDGRRNERRW